MPPRSLPEILEDAYERIARKVRHIHFRSTSTRWFRICVESATPLTSAKRGEFSTNSYARHTTWCARCLGVPVRRHFQKMHLRGWERIRFPDWPVDTTVERIHQKLLALSLKAQGLERIPFIWFWPEGFSSCAILTHDVEDPPGKAFCGRLMDLDEAAGFRSSFQVVPENRYPVSASFLDSITSGASRSMSTI